MQQALLLHHLQLGKSDSGFLQMSFTLCGSLNTEEFRRAWKKVVARHPVLRTAIYCEELEQPMQVVYRRTDLPWEYHDWRDSDQADHQQRLNAFFEDDRKKGFQLSQAPVIRLALVQLSDDKHQFTWSCHHITIRWLVRGPGLKRSL